MSEVLRDAIGKSVEERFLEIRDEFLGLLMATGHARTTLYTERTSNHAFSEEEVVRHWAGLVAVRVNDICIGIQSAFVEAGKRSAMVTSFRYCVPHIHARINELAETRVGQGPVVRQP